MSSTSKWDRRVLLLFLLVIFFIYKIVDSFIAGDSTGVYLWIVFTIIYCSSLGILVIIMYKNKKIQVES